MNRLGCVASHLAPPAQPTAAASASRPTGRIAVVGLGWWTTAHHLPDLQDNPAADVVAAVEPLAERRQEVSAKYGFPTYDSVEAMVASGVAIDGVVIASAHVAHFENALACIKAGWSVLVEKPMTTTAAEAAQLLAAAHQHKVTISVNNTANFNAQTDEAAALVAAGTLGEVRHVVCTMAGDLADLFGSAGMETTSPHRAGDRDPTINYAPMASTWADPKRAGGYGWGQMTHSLAWAFEVSGLTPHQVFAFDGKSPAGVDYYDSATVRCTNGATMVLSGAATALIGQGTRVEIFGDKGTLTYESGVVNVAVRGHDGEPNVNLPVPANPSIDVEKPIGQAGLWRFVERCRGVDTASTRNSADGGVGLRVVQCLEGIYSASATGELYTVETIDAPVAAGAE
jgi:predicted dehydrogenase